MDLPTFATVEEDIAADAVATAFTQARQAARPSYLERMGRNTFRQQVCRRDMRLSSGWINSVAYRTSDPAQLPESAQRLATSADTYKIAARFRSGSLPARWWVCGAAELFRLHQLNLNRTVFSVCIKGLQNVLAAAMAQASKYIVIEPAVFDAPVLGASR